MSADQRHFEEALKKYRQLTCPKLAVAGNHDLWVEDEEENSIEKYRYVLYGHTHVRKEQAVDGVLAVTHSVGYEWEWAERGMDTKDSVRFFHI